MPSENFTFSPLSDNGESSNTKLLITFRFSKCRFEYRLNAILDFLGGFVFYCKDLLLIN